MTLKLVPPPPTRPPGEKPSPPAYTVEQLFALAKADYREIRRRRLAEEKAGQKQERKPCPS